MVFLFHQKVPFLLQNCVAAGYDIKVEEVETATNGLLFIFRLVSTIMIYPYIIYSDIPRPTAVTVIETDLNEIYYKRPKFLNINV